MKTAKSSKRPIKQFEHRGKKTYSCDRTSSRRAHGWIGVEIADDRGIENLKVVRLG